ncbi:proton phosphate symporter [Raphidocelis subcapitata]|uniref:Proton phosphate symporter n=1 Tax=Raphidocelis subcapitata TaxID=307507 RepID=A0A2V0P1T9_9CHLO|nr:proton phosphate symporter [Raphidocelis subcapitata]|eukprot:GBF93836.1 proton phosphate symporter [Raphidocelis subcapitata]
MSQLTSPFAQYAVASSSGTGSPRTPPPGGAAAAAAAASPAGPAGAADKPLLSAAPSTRGGAAPTTLGGTTIGGTTIGSLSILSTIDVGDLHRLSRMSSFSTVARYTKPKPPPPPVPRPLAAWLGWWAAWALPGLGMFCEAYILFSIGLVKPLLAAAAPSCFVTFETCTEAETHLVNYIPIAARIVGMLLFGTSSDVMGRAWASRIVASIMLGGALLLVFAPLLPSAPAFVKFYLAAQTIYGFGVGGEYPVASASAAERSQSDPALRQHRGQQVALTFSQQGAGNFANACVILALMAAYGQTGGQLDAAASRDLVVLQAAFIAGVSLFLVAWRFLVLRESEVWRAEREDAVDIAANVEHRKTHHLYSAALRWLGPRLAVTSGAWVCNDFAFYGNRLFLSTFIAAMYPKATPFERMRWSALNSGVAYVGYFVAAALMDRPWWGRRRMQSFGFFMLFLLFLTVGAGYPALTASTAGYRAFQALYFLSSFFNQAGPNSTTWLVAAEVFPTDVRATFQGVSAAWGKAGALAADVLFAYVSVRTSFFLSAAFGLLGCLLTLLLLPDTTGLPLDELDRMHKYMLTGHFEYYHGDAVRPQHLSLFERFVLKWHARYDPALDAAHKEIQSLAPSVHRKPADAAPPPAPWPSAPLTWSDGGWSAAGGGGGGEGGAALDALGRGVTGPSWAPSYRSNAASRRLPATGEEGEGEGEEGAAAAAAAGGGAASRGGGPRGSIRRERMEEID